MDLQQFFKEYPKCALAFSGGVDSSYLLYAVKQYGADVRAYYVKAAFQPQFELDDAMRLADELQADMKVLRVDVLSDAVVRSNPKDRCYYCKQLIFSTILAEAKKDGYTMILDGTNASDDIADRPGFRALQELKVLSPLRITGLTGAGLERTALTVPARIDGLAVTQLSRETFSGSKALAEVTLQENLTFLEDRSFEGCSSLETIHIRAADPVHTMVGTGLLSGTDAVIRVPAESLSAYRLNYSWSVYGNRLQAE